MFCNGPVWLAGLDFSFLLVVLLVVLTVCKRQPDISFFFSLFMLAAVFPLAASVCRFYFLSIRFVSVRLPAGFSEGSIAFLSLPFFLPGCQSSGGMLDSHLLRTDNVDYFIGLACRKQVFQYGFVLDDFDNAL